MWLTSRVAARNRRKPCERRAFESAEEDSNLHPVSLDQALNLVTRVSDASYASIASKSSGNLDASDVMDDLDVAADVATTGLAPQLAGRRRYCQSLRIA
jgi:hypothetical protein